MAEQHLQDARLTLTGAGFAGDPEAQDGVHLRWSFDPELGFPAEGFTLWYRPATRPDMRKMSFAGLATALEAQPAPAGVEDGVTVHRADGSRLEPGRRCDQRGLELGSSPLVLRFRPTFGTPPSLVRMVTVFGVAERGAVSVRARHGGRIADCAAVGVGSCLRRIVEPDVADRLMAMGGSEVVLAGRHHRPGGETRSVREVIKADRAAALERLREVRSGFQPAASCTPFQLTIEADAIDEVLVSGCNAVLVGALWSPIPEDECDREWQRLHGPICLPVEGVAGYPCQVEDGEARQVAADRLPDEADLPVQAPRRADLETRLLGREFDELRGSLERALDMGGQFVIRLSADDPEDGTTWRYDVVRDALTAAADPYFARILGLYWVHRKTTPSERFDYMVEAAWPIDGERRRLCWVIYDRGIESQPALPAPTNVAASASPGAAHVDVDGNLNPYEMDVTVSWRRPTVCELADPVRSPIGYFVERTDADAPASGPYRPITRTFEAGGEPEVVLSLIADPEDGPARFDGGYFVDRGPGYGTFHYRVLGRDLFGRTSDASNPGAVLVTDQVSPGPPLNLAAEYADPLDPERAGGALLGWANRDAAPGDPDRAGIAVRWTWPRSRQLQFPDLAEFRLYYRPGTLNHALGRIESVAEVAPGEYDVLTDILPVGPDFPVPQAGVDLGALRSEGEECGIVTLATVGGRLAFRVRANPAAPPVVGPVTFRLGRGTPATATQPARTAHPAFRSFEDPADWAGLLIDPTAPPTPLRIAADGSNAGPLPAGLGPSDVEVVRTTETVDGEDHWHYTVRLRGIELAPSVDRPRAVGTFGVGSVDAAGNAGRIAPPASVMAVHREAPVVPPLVYPPINLATPADYHDTSWFTLEWTGESGVGYQVYRAVDLDLLATAGVPLADHRARSDDEQRLELQQLALDPANIEGFRLVTPQPVPGRTGPMRHRDAIPGGVRNRFVYRIRSISRSGNLAPWPPAASASCVVVDLPGVPPPAPLWADVGYPPGGGVALRWVPNAGIALAGYRLYRATDADAATDIRSMVPLFTGPQDEGGGQVTGVVLARDAGGAITSLTELAAGDRPPGRLVQHVDATAPAGRQLYYRLVAQDALGLRSPASERLLVQLPKTQPPAPPAWSPPVVAAGSVDLSWTASEADLRCLVLRRSGGGMWRPLGPWAGPGDYGFTDTSIETGTPYDYRVRVRDDVGHVVDGPILTVTAT